MCGFLPIRGSAGQPLSGKGDVLVVWKLDRLGRSLSFLISLIEKLQKYGAGFEPSLISSGQRPECRRPRSGESIWADLPN
ncbi:recombinase family protein [Nitrosospira briensis]|uniref:recombinase family protein n=1 Tax=Nitrosospira briensis TaxID=35799 RepID=UPI0027379264|nr:recombinase family protein [Nitrosospira briensis]